MTNGAPPPLRPAKPRRSGPLRYLPLGIAAWLVLEIWLLTVVAGATSGLVVFLLLVGGLLLGSAVINRASRACRPQDRCRCRRHPVNVRSAVKIPVQGHASPSYAAPCCTHQRPVCHI
ncbi:hypothetical protein SALBM135S_09702 [Streptomyces alboniger]